MSVGRHLTTLRTATAITAMATSTAAEKQLL